MQMLKLLFQSNFTPSVNDIPSEWMYWQVPVRAMVIIIESMMFTSYSDMSYLVAIRGGYVASIQTMSHDKFKHKERQQFFVARQIFLSRDMILVLRRGGSHYIITVKHECCNRHILVWLSVNYSKNPHLDEYSMMSHCQGNAKIGV